jgi:ribonuclease R
VKKTAGTRKTGSGTIEGTDAPAVPALPTRDEILAFIAREREAQGEKTPAKIGKREIARAFGVKGSDKIGLKRVLKELESEGTIERRRKSLHKAGLLPAVVLAEIFSRDRDGDLLAVPAEWNTDDGEAPKIILFLPRVQRKAGPAPGLGDRALVRVEPLRDAKAGEPAYSGRIIKLLTRAKAQVLGIYQSDPLGGGRVSPVDKKSASRGDYRIRPGDEGAAEDGDLVAIDIMAASRLGLPAARVREKLGSLSSERAISLIAIHTHGIPNQFSPEALAEAEHMRASTMDHREDWRALPLVTIDPADAKDHDDAVYAEADDDPANKGGHIICVAIADVASYVRPQTPLDKEALERGNSVYFPDRVVPMLPERISNDLCSLRALEDRPALAVRMIVDAHGRKLRHTFHRIMMRSAAKLSYPQAQAAIDGAPDEITSPILASVLRPLWAAYQAVKVARDQRAPLDLDLPERKILLKSDGTIDRVIVPMRLDAHRLIEEFMILANVAAAETLEDKRHPLIYRAHDEPSVEKLNNLAEFLATIGIKLAKGQVLKPEQFNGILKRVRDTDNEQLVNEVVLRSQAQAEYASENYGHFGLNLRRYTHFTSPIRRYADLIVHRALIKALQLGPGGMPDTTPDQLKEVAERISAAERRAMAAERETTDRLIATHLANCIGAQFEGRISGVTRVGLFVKLAETGADGFIPAATLGTDYFRYEETQHALVGSRSRVTHRLGDPVTVKLVEAAPFAGALRFELIETGETGRGQKPLKSIRGSDSGPHVTKGRSRLSKVHRS